MNKISDSPVHIIPNGIDLARYENLSRNMSRIKLGIANNEKIIVFVGRIRPVKGVPYLIEAMSLIRRKNKSCRLMLVGYGDEENINALIKKYDLTDCVSFVGKVSNEDVPGYLIASDVFVLPSLYEGFGIVILEAMAAGLPVISTNVGGPPDIIKDGVNGYLVGTKNSEQIADSVIRLLDDDRLREKMSESNITEVKKYGWESVAKQVESLFKPRIKG
jgi:glycosyltransferase involved in cell wall biosynthesis